MKAVRLLEYGEQLVFDDVPKPTIARDEVLVKVRSTAVNHLPGPYNKGMAERVGFEPTVEFPPRSLSRRVLSTAQSPLRSGQRSIF